MKHNSQFGKWFAAALLAGMIGLSGLALWPSPPAKTPAFAKGVAHVIKSDGTVLSFDVDIAETAEEQAYGLMYRQAVPRGTGMIFAQNPETESVFWMKNTLVSLDLIFADRSGKIVKIAEQAIPLDLRPISADRPVATVLEVGGGEAKRLGIAVGDKLGWSKE